MPEPITIGSLLLAAAVGLPTELTGALSSSLIAQKFDDLQSRMSRLSPGANHDLQRALTDSFWLSLLFVAARHGEWAGAPLMWPDRLARHKSITAAWSWLRERTPSGQPPPRSMNAQATADVARALYPRLIAKLEAPHEAPPLGIDAAYQEMHAILAQARSSTPTPAFLDILRIQAVEQLTILAHPLTVPTRMEEALRRDFEALFRGGFAQAIKSKPEVSSIFNATQLSEIRQLLEERLPRPPSPAPGPPDPAPYIEYLRKTTGTIELVGLRVGANLDPIAIDKLWVAARTRVTAAEGRQRDALAGAEATEELSAALNRNRVLVIEGVAGSGKSTFLKRIAFALCREDPGNERLALDFHGLPVWLPVTVLESYLNALFPKGPPTTTDLRWISQCLADLSDKKGWALRKEFFDAALRDPGAILLLDGLDESSGAWRPKLAKLILDARDAFPCRLVVTMRPEAEYSDPLLKPIKDRCSILDLEVPEIEEFLRLWTQSVPSNDLAAAQADAQRLLTNLHSNPAIKKMACNPLMLSVLAALTYRGVPLPEQRADLYGAIVKWLARSRYDSDNQEKTLLSHLSLLSLQMIGRGGTPYQIGYKDAARLIENVFRPEPPLQKATAAELFLRDAQLRCGLTRERGGDLVFCHREFQDYLAAARLADSRDKDREDMAVEFVKQRRAPEVLRLFAGCLQSGSTNDRLSDLFKCLIDYATPLDIEPRAYAVGVIGGMRADLIPTNYAMPDDLKGRYDQLVKSVLAMFDLEESAKISIPIRRDAAEALALGGDPRLRLPADPTYWVKVPGGNFWIGQYPVTVYEYQVYLDRRGGPAPTSEWEEKTKWLEQSQHPSRPVTRVTWDEAMAYCKWAGDGRNSLPTERQWELAASGPGPSPRVYPWGDDDPTPEHANFSETGLGSPSPVGLFPKGATPGESHPEKIYDLAGNVWEWSADDEPERDGWKRLRGAAFYVGSWDLRAACRLNNPLGDRYDYIGFRCAREVSP